MKVNINLRRIVNQGAGYFPKAEFNGYRRLENPHPGPCRSGSCCSRSAQPKTAPAYPAHYSSLGPFLLATRTKRKTPTKFPWPGHAWSFPLRKGSAQGRYFSELLMSVNLVLRLVPRP